MKWRGDPLLFLDIDGVLNDHMPHENGFCCLGQDFVDRFNTILRISRPHVVLVSAWRYFIIRQEMTIGGFNGMLQTHGVDRNCIMDITGPDIFDTDGKTDRGASVLAWFVNNPAWRNAPYVIVDDMDLGYSQRSMPFVQPRNGLSAEDVDGIVRRLA